MWVQIPLVLDIICFQEGRYTPLLFYGEVAKLVKATDSYPVEHRFDSYLRHHYYMGMYWFRQE